MTTGLVDPVAGVPSSSFFHLGSVANRRTHRSMRFGAGAHNPPHFESFRPAAILKKRPLPPFLAQELLVCENMDTCLLAPASDGGFCRRAAP